MPELLLTPANISRWLQTYASELDAFGETEEGRRLRAASAIIIEADKRVNRPQEEARWIVQRLLHMMLKPCRCAILEGRECSRCRGLTTGKKLFAPEYIRAADINASIGPTN